MGVEESAPEAEGLHKQTLSKEEAELWPGQELMAPPITRSPSPGLAIVPTV